MDNQVEFPFAAGSETSKAAARRVDPGKAAIDRAMILEWIRSGGVNGRTDTEIQKALDIPGDTERPRRNELAGRGRTSKRHPFWPKLIEPCPCGTRRNGCVVWVIANG